MSTKGKARMRFAQIAASPKKENVSTKGKARMRFAQIAASPKN